MTPVVPTIRDDTLAPPGKHVVNLFGGHAPYELKGQVWDEAKRAEAGRRRARRDRDLRARLALRDHRRCRSCSPPTSSGSWACRRATSSTANSRPDQVFFTRPAAHYADYRTPIRGLYVCGSSMHPGGGVSGIPGHNAAREILKDRGKRLN